MSLRSLLFWCSITAAVLRICVTLIISPWVSSAVWKWQQGSFRLPIKWLFTVGAVTDVVWEAVAVSPLTDLLMPQLESGFSAPPRHRPHPTPDFPSGTVKDRLCWYVHQEPTDLLCQKCCMGPFFLYTSWVVLHPGWSKSETLLGVDCLKIFSVIVFFLVIFWPTCATLKYKFVTLSPWDISALVSLT